MLDFHTHILPNMDDGAKDIEESETMIKKLIEQGMTHICLTPHYYAYKESKETFLERRKQRFELISETGKFENVQFLLGAEVYFIDAILNIDDFSELTVNKTKYILTELPYEEPCSNKIIKKMEKFISDKNVIPVLAHIDRYPELMKNSKILDEFLHMGCLAQMNLYSLDNGFTDKRILLKYLKEGKITFWGTDSHGMKRRPPDCKRYFEWLIKKWGNENIIKLSEKQIGLLT